MKSQIVEKGFVPTNGINLYYEVYGSGEPLILLHGGLGTNEMFSSAIPELARQRRVIAVELQAHGHTADIDRPMQYESFGDDIAGLIGYLGLGKADIMGYSLGAGTALQTAFRHPKLVRKLVIISFPCKYSGWFETVEGAKQMGPATAEAMKQSPWYEAYLRATAKPEDWVVLHTKLGKLVGTDFDWSSDIRNVSSPVLLIYGDADAIRPAGILEFFALLGGGLKDGGWDGSGQVASRLAILPGLTHYNILSSPASSLAVTQAVLPFLAEAGH